MNLPNMVLNLLRKKFNSLAEPSRELHFYSKVKSLLNAFVVSFILLCSVNTSAQSICGDITLPLSFSPNGDGINDVFMVVGNCIEDVHIEVFNRWGSLMFKSDELTNPWRGDYEGKPCEAGVFYYTYSVKLANGEEKRGNGNVYLER